jgi:hypothetical protein
MWGDAMTPLSVKVAFFVAALVVVASLNTNRHIQKALGFNRHMPKADAFTMFWMAVGAILLTTQAIFDFTLFDLMPVVIAYCVYVFVGISSVWQLTRQS